MNLTSKHMKSNKKQTSNTTLVSNSLNPLNVELNPICHLLVLLGDLTFMGPCIVSTIPVHVYIQQDATLHSLFISWNCSTCFGWYFHPSSRAHTIVSTASVICHTVTAICRYRGRVGTGVAVTVWQIPDAVDTVVCAPDDGWKYHPKHVEQFPDILEYY
jgi:hypothetical protein